MSMPAEAMLQFFGHLNATAHDHHVDVVGGTLQENVTHIAAYHVALNAQMVGSLTYLMEYLLIKDFSQLFVGIKLHL
jgi:hypothetical protein